MKISEYLEDLGETPEQVAASLVSQNIKGIRKSAYMCPVVRGIRGHCRAWPGLHSPQPGVLSNDDGQIMDPQCPTPVAEFMRRFDAGEFDEVST